MYNTKTATINNEEFNSNYIPVGINDNITLKEVSVEKSPQGKDFLRVTFENEAGQTAEFTEWKNEKNMWIKTDADLQNKDNQQFGRIIQLINCFTTTPDVEINSFDEMIKWVKGILDPFIKDKKNLRLKVTYNKNGYTQVSKYGTYVEPMDVAESQIKLFKNDLLERPVKADAEKPADPLATNPMNVDTPVTEAKDVNELPF
ncbi:hypothetical protein [uncultured phage cr130_1]|uniref:Uncharacterized protein n=1 Tax=uncultured phage cr130_1 TaxID=2772092 RepID=A0A7M1RTG3_9CAUD|nr:hypothetical protein KNV59_gp05 [uncultured phage cr130_1]QOR57618.1 hypothetical protein [uncultured phage cr130_1]